MEIEGLTFPEALKLLAERNGIPMPKRTEFADAESKLRGVLMEMHAIAAQVFQANLQRPAGRGGAGLSGAPRRDAGDDRRSSAWVSPIRPGRRWFAASRTAAFTAEQHGASGLVRRREEGGGILRFLPRAADVSHSQRIRQSDRLRRTRHAR